MKKMVSVLLVCFMAISLLMVPVNATDASQKHEDVDFCTNNDSIFIYEPSMFIPKKTLRSAKEIGYALGFTVPTNTNAVAKSSFTCDGKTNIDFDFDVTLGPPDVLVSVGVYDRTRGIYTWVTNGRGSIYGTVRVETAGTYSLAFRNNDLTNPVYVSGTYYVR